MGGIHREAGIEKDFQGIEEDLEKLQQVINSGKIGSKRKRNGWQSASQSV